MIEHESDQSSSLFSFYPSTVKRQIQNEVSYDNKSTLEDSNLPPSNYCHDNLFPEERELSTESQPFFPNQRQIRRNLIPFYDDNTWNYWNQSHFPETPDLSKYREKK